MRMAGTLALAASTLWAAACVANPAHALPILDSYVVTTYLANDSPYEVHGPFGDYVNGTPYDYRPFPRLPSFYSRTVTTTVRTVTTTSFGSPPRRRHVRRMARRHPSRPGFAYPAYASVAHYGVDD